MLDKIIKQSYKIYNDTNANINFTNLETKDFTKFIGIDKPNYIQIVINIRLFIAKFKFKEMLIIDKNISNSTEIVNVTNSLNVTAIDIFIKIKDLKRFDKL